VISAWIIRDEDIDNEAARAADEGDGSKKDDRKAPRISSLSDLLADRRILIFTGPLSFRQRSHASSGWRNAVER
jgi:hypothetical protein